MCGVGWRESWLVDWMLFSQRKNLFLIVLSLAPFLRISRRLVKERKFARVPLANQDRQSEVWRKAQSYERIKNEKNKSRVCRWMRWKGTHQNNGTENEVEDKYAFQGSFAFTLSLLIAGWLWLITIWPHSEICLSYWICIGFALVLFLKFAAVQLAVSCRYFIPTYSITALGWHFRPSVFEHFGIDNRTQLPYFLLGVKLT